MAIKHGHPEEVKKLLKICPKGIDKFEDIENTLKTLKDDKDSKKKRFDEHLPNLKTEEKNKLKLQEDEKAKTEKK